MKNLEEYPMTQLLLAKETLKTFVGRYEVYLKPLGKFLLALAALMMINSSTGYMERLNSMSIVLIVALMCSFLPMNFTIICAAGFYYSSFLRIINGMCPGSTGTVFNTGTGVFSFFARRRSNSITFANVFLSEDAICNSCLCGASCKSCFGQWR